MPKIQMRFICIGRNHQIGQFPVPPGEGGKPQPPELKPIVGVTLVPDGKKGPITEDLNHPIWNGDVNGKVEIQFATPEAMAGFEPNQKYLVTIEPCEELTVQ